MKLRLTRTASRQLDHILDYVAERHPVGARHVQGRILEIMRLLLIHPHMGPATMRPRRRLMLASPYPYAITYRIDDDEIVILGIRHTARRPL